MSDNSNSHSNSTSNSNINLNYNSDSDSNSDLHDIFDSSCIIVNNILTYDYIIISSFIFKLLFGEYEKCRPLV